MTLSDEDLQKIDQLFSGRFQRLEDKLIKIENRLISIEKRLTNVEERLTNVEERLTEVESRLINVENRLDVLEPKVSDMYVVLMEHVAQVKNLESQFFNFRVSFHSVQDIAYGFDKHLSLEFPQLREQVDDNSKRISKLEQ